jgi:Glu-tRNA(Gln) amidotransferase subunit E-like FAD-binding protein
MKSLVELAYDKHKDWINIVKSFGANKNYAEDIVQEMYIQLICDIKKGLDLSYNQDINTYYCYKVLRGIYLNTHKKEAKFLKTYIEDINGEIKEVEDLGIDEVEYAKQKDNIDEILKEMYWYDSKVFSLVASGKSVASLSRDTKISYYSLYNTYRTALKNIKEKL